MTDRRHHHALPPGEPLGDAQRHRLHAARRRAHVRSPFRRAVTSKRVSPRRLRLLGGCVDAALCRRRGRAAHRPLGRRDDARSALRRRAPNLTVQQHIFEGLVRIDERGRVTPGIAVSWTTPDPLTWELKLQAGREIPRRLGAHARGRRVLARAAARDQGQPRRLRDLRAADHVEADRRQAHAAAEDRGAVRAAAAGPRARADRVEARGGHGDERGFRQRQGGDRHRPFQAREVRARRPRAARAPRRVLGRPAGVGHASRCASCRTTRRARRRCSRATSTRSRTCPPPTSPRLRKSAAHRLAQTVSWRTILLHLDQHRAPPPGVTDKAGKPLAGESVQGRARAARDVEGDQPPGDRRARHGRPRAAGVERRLPERDRPRSGGETRSLRSRRREEAARRSGLSRTASR